MIIYESLIAVLTMYFLILFQFTKVLLYSNQLQDLGKIEF